MKNWGKTRLLGKWRFACWFGLVISFLLASDFYLVKVILDVRSSFKDFLLTWTVLFPFSLLFGLYGWRLMEFEWKKKSK
ncbi:hypothetical protein [Peribacillus alkalitolerans]|uniref:hypothetical protein n=1 Tax=Peribacillus alkalitolerans TaxID=1550385 RepID=UPI0013D0E49E|nr:hypothetical protein [Peribacillus alkalitolerans]